jgi:hypothetical protein
MDFCLCGAILNLKAVCFGEKKYWMGIKVMPISANKKGGCHHTGLDV